MCNAFGKLCSKVLIMWLIGSVIRNYRFANASNFLKFLTFA